MHTTAYRDSGLCCLYVAGLCYIDLAKPKSGAPGLFIRTGYRISENKRLWNCPPLDFPGNCLIMSFSSRDRLITKLGFRVGFRVGF